MIVTYLPLKMVLRSRQVHHRLSQHHVRGGELNADSDPVFDEGLYDNPIDFIFIIACLFCQ